MASQSLLPRVKSNTSTSPHSDGWRGLFLLASCAVQEVATPNHSGKRTPYSVLRTLPVAAYLER